MLIAACVSQYSVISTTGRNLFNDFKDFSVTSFLRNDIFFTSKY